MSQDARFGPAPDAVDKPATDGFALAALLCSLPGLVPFAVLFGIIALVRIQVSGRSGRGLAIAALVISGLWLVGALYVVISMIPGPNPTGTGQVAPPTSTRAGRPEVTNYDSVFYVQVDNCFDTIDVDEDHVQQVDCAGTHDEQLYAIVALDGASWPGVAAVRSQVHDGCGKQSRSYFTASAPPPDLQVMLYYTTEDNWKDGIRYGSCAFTKKSGKLSGRIPH